MAPVARSAGTVLAWGARVVGASALLLGTAHLQAIVRELWNEELEYSQRAVFLLWTGGILIFSGLLNLGVSGGLRRGQPWAWRVSGAAAALAWLFTLSLMPVFSSNLNYFLLAVHTLYLLYWITHRL